MDLNIDLKNLKIEDIKEKLLKLADKKTLIKIGIGAGAVIIFLIIYYAVLNPIVNKKKVQLDDMNKKKQETTELIQKIKSKQKQNQIQTGWCIIKIMHISVRLLLPGPETKWVKPKV